MNWIILQRLHQIYEEGKTKTNKTLLNDAEIKYLIYSTKELYLVGKFICKGKDFDRYYESLRKDKYKLYKHFLNRNNLLKKQTRFKEENIQTLIDIEKGMQDGTLQKLRNQIIEAEETVRGVSLMFFENEKYLLKHPSLVNAVKQLLQIDELADEKDQQYKYVLECDSPKLIVLCENIDFLKRPENARKNNIELWYAGGKNIDKLNYVDTRGLKIFYSRDWDYDGLKIYQTVRRKIPQIEILFPNGKPRSITDTKHESLWRLQDNIALLSELDKNLFNSEEQKLIK